MQAAEQGCHDPGEAVSTGQPFQQAVLESDDLHHPGQTGEATRQSQRQRLMEGNVDPGIAGGIGV